MVSHHSVHYTTGVSCVCLHFNMSQGIIWKRILRVIDIRYILSLKSFVLVNANLTSWSNDIRIVNTMTLGDN